MANRNKSKRGSDGKIIPNKLNSFDNNEIKIEQNFECGVCAISSWNNKPIVNILEIHHIDGNRKNNNRDNLVALCPNCHRQTENWGNKSRKLPKEVEYEDEDDSYDDLPPSKLFENSLKKYKDIGSRQGFGGCRSL